MTAVVASKRDLFSVLLFSGLGVKWFSGGSSSANQGFIGFYISDCDCTG